jgi:hypothetical protein
VAKTISSFQQDCNDFPVEKTATGPETDHPAERAAMRPIATSVVTPDGTQYELGELLPTATVLSMKETLATISHIPASNQSIYLIDEMRQCDELELNNCDTVREVRTFAPLSIRELRLAVVVVATHNWFDFKSLKPSSGWLKPHSFDGNGVLSHIGTEGGTKEYRNPHTSGEVIAAMSSTDSGSSADRFVMHSHNGKIFNQTTQGGFQGQAGQWMKVDLGEGRSLIPNHYCLRHGNSDGNFRLCFWRFEGSQDGSTWVTLREHMPDDWDVEFLGRGGRKVLGGCSDAFRVGHWAVQGIKVAYRHFRIVQIGPNSSRNHSLRCAGLELYGELWEELQLSCNCN